MASVWDWVIMVIVLGLVSTFEILLIGSMVSKIIESKMKVKAEVELKYLDRSMETLGTYLDKIVESISKLVDKEREVNQPTIRKIDF